MDKKKKKDKQYKFFADAFHEVVVPLLENMATKDDVKDMANKDDIDKINSRLVKIDDKLERYGNRPDGHEKRITKLENKVAIAS